MKIILAILAALLAGSALADVPQAAKPYQRAVTREARAVWGLNAPIAVLGAQIGQESRWRPDVCSAFACGLSQFTPQTAAWISGVYPKELGENDPFNPNWAIRALVRYDNDLYKGTPKAETDCEQWAFTLSAYNGGLGWVRRDAALCERADGCVPTAWFGNVEMQTARSAAAARENRGYPRRILLTLQTTYLPWGPGVSCGGHSDT